MDKIDHLMAEKNENNKDSRMGQVTHTKKYKLKKTKISKRNFFALTLSEPCLKINKSLKILKSEQEIKVKACILGSFNGGHSHLLVRFRISRRPQSLTHSKSHGTKNTIGSVKFCVLKAKQIIC